jgi:hypothetical protein
MSEESQPDPPPPAHFPDPPGPPAVHAARFTAAPLGHITILTFFGFAGTKPGASPQIVPAFSVALTDSDVVELRDVLTQVLLARQTLAADSASRN